MIWASSPAPARPRAIAWSGAGAATTVSQARHDSEGLADFVGDLAQRAAATRTSARCGMAPILSGQVFRQWTPRRLLRFGRGLDGCSDRRRCRHQALRLVGFQRLERQLELL